VLGKVREVLYTLKHQKLFIGIFPYYGIMGSFLKGLKLSGANFMTRKSWQKRGLVFLAVIVSLFFSVGFWVSCSPEMLPMPVVCEVCEVYPCTCQEVIVCEGCQKEDCVCCYDCKGYPCSCPPRLIPFTSISNPTLNPPPIAHEYRGDPRETNSMFDRLYRRQNLVLITSFDEAYNIDHEKVNNFLYLKEDIDLFFAKNALILYVHSYPNGSIFFAPAGFISVRYLKYVESVARNLDSRVGLSL